MLALFFSILESITNSLSLGRWATRSARFLGQLSIPGTQRAHRSELRRRLDSIPFIYRELEGTLESDYVPTSYRPRDLATIDVDDHILGRSAPGRGSGASRHVPEPKEIDQADRGIRSSPRTLFLGNAGIGKTTFLSRITFSLTARSDTATRQRFFPENSHLVPIFVPLKVLDNSHPQPIFTYLREAYPYFRGRWGWSRLRRLAEEGKLLLVLDGYDEIYTPGSDSEGFVARDINALFGSFPDRSLHDQLSEEVARLYFLMVRNRVWLTSRKDYYRANRLQSELDESGRGHHHRIVCVELLGIASRLDLVKKIFDKYREASKKHRDLLSEDVFLAYVHRTFDDEMVALTYNPLFLTIMCYVYVRELDAGESAQPGEFRTMRQTLLQCVHLLLTDLDQHKVRGLPPRIRRALEEKRGLYSEEKFSFLGYFAAEVEADPNRVRRAFTKDEIVDAAVRFFSRESGPHGEEILRGLSRDDTSSIVNQLIKQELFVTVITTYSVLYDFPHRRFREVLASTYLDTPERIEQILESLDDVNQREFLLVLFAVTETQADRILEAILKRAEDPQSQAYFVTLAGSCIKARGSGYDATAILQRWLRHGIQAELLQGAPGALLPWLRPTESFLAWLESDVAHVQRPPQIAVAAGATLYYLQPSRFLRLLSDALDRDAELAALLLDVLISSDPDAFTRLVEDAGNAEHVRLFGTVAIIRRGVQGGEIWWRRMCASLPLADIAYLMGVAARHAPHLMPRLMGFEGPLPYPVSPPVEDGTWTHVYVVAHGTVDDLDVARGRKALRSTPEGIYGDLSFLPFLELPVFEQVADVLSKDRESWQTHNAFVAENRKRIQQEVDRLHEEETQKTLAFVVSRISHTRAEWLEFLRQLRQDDAIMGILGPAAVVVPLDEESSSP